MLRGSHVLLNAGQADEVEDFEGGDVVRVAKRSLPFDASTPPGRRKAIKAAAIAILRRNGMRAADIAIAVEYSERHVWRRSATIRDFAEATGRV